MVLRLSLLPLERRDRGFVDRLAVERTLSSVSAGDLLGPRGQLSRGDIEGKHGDDTESGAVVGMTELVLKSRFVPVGDVVVKLLMLRNRCLNFS